MVANALAAAPARGDPSRPTLRGDLRQFCCYAVPEVAALTGKPVQLLTGGTLAWIAAGLPLAHGDSGLAVERRDRYRRPYEGTDNSAEAMQAIWSGSMARGSAGPRRHPRFSVL